MTRTSLTLAILLATAACTQAPDPVSRACATPADADAAADVTLTAQDAALPMPDGVQFVAWTYDGDVPGPVLRVPLGATRRVKLVNASPRPVSLHFHGVTYAAADDGTPTSPESLVNPGCAHVYTITATVPGVWAYHSHHDSRTEMAYGLHGAVVVPDPAEAPADHEYVAFLGQLGLEGEGGAPEEGEAGEGGAAPFFGMTINGRVDGGAEVIELQGDRYVVREGVASGRVGDRVRWRVVNVSPDDGHTFHLHGHRWCDRGGVANGAGLCPDGALPVDNVDVFSAQGFSMEYVEDNPGDWMIHCHVIDHVVDGMWATYEVTP